MILSRAGKSSGVNKYWFNIKDLEDGSMKSVDFENINGWKNLNEEVLLCKNETFDIVEAKLKELETGMFMKNCHPCCKLKNLQNHFFGINLQQIQ